MEKINSLLVGINTRQERSLGIDGYIGQAHRWIDGNLQNMVFCGNLSLPEWSLLYINTDCPV